MWLESSAAGAAAPTIAIDIEVIGEGKVFPCENCAVNTDQTRIEFLNPSALASVRVEPIREGGQCTVSVGNFSLPDDTTLVMFENTSQYGTVVFDFS